MTFKERLLEEARNPNFRSGPNTPWLVNKFNNLQRNIRAKNLKQQRRSIQNATLNNPDMITQQGKLKSSAKKMYHGFNRRLVGEDADKIRFSNRTELTPPKYTGTGTAIGKGLLVPAALYGGASLFFGGDDEPEIDTTEGQSEVQSTEANPEETTPENKSFLKNPAAMAALGAGTAVGGSYLYKKLRGK